jgi:hypothetical protein
LVGPAGIEPALSVSKTEVISISLKTLTGTSGEDRTLSRTLIWG